MYEKYINKLVDNLPNDITSVKKPIPIDIILDGGMFNGSYLIGALYFLKEMEKRKYIIVERISGCSIGSLVGVLYCVDRLDLYMSMYSFVLNQFKQTYKLKVIKDLKSLVGDQIPMDVCKRMEKKMYISYYNINKWSKKVKCKYKNIDEVFDTIAKSCFVPFVIDGNVLYKNKYFDGISPYIFKEKPNKKILFMYLLGYDKLTYIINVKNEKDNVHRVFNGILDIYTFFIKKHNTSICSYVNDWNIIHKMNYQLKLGIEIIIHLFVYFVVFVKTYILTKVGKKYCVRIFKKLYMFLLDKYCF